MTQTLTSEAFETFANQHPIEAFDLDKPMFCEYVRKRVATEITDEQIEQLINEHRDEQI